MSMFQTGLSGLSVARSALMTTAYQDVKDNDRVIFGLMNEPNTMATEQWGAAAQGAINAIRATGAAN